VNSTGTIVQFKRYRRVCFYTVKFEGSELTEADKFFEKVENEEEYGEYVDNLVKWIKDIGNNRGARYELFRDERIAVALPPPRQHLRTHNFVKDLRLYCFWVSPNIVILFNGGIKTKINPVQCPNVSMHFHNANNWSKQLVEHELDYNGLDLMDTDNIEIYD